MRRSSAISTTAPSTPVARGASSSAGQKPMLPDSRSTSV